MATHSPNNCRRDENASFAAQHFKVIPGTYAIFDDDNLCVTLPTRETFTTDARGADWIAAERSLSVSGRLYLYSGHFLAELPVADSRSEFIQNSFWTWTLSMHFRSLAKSFASWDHSVALRTELALYLLLTHRAGPIPEMTERIRRDIAWACEPGNVKRNNHGMFLMRALLFASRVYNSIEIWPAQHGSDWHKIIDATIASNLRAIVTYVYGDDGWCGENSPMYDRVWINLLRRMLGDFSAQLQAIHCLDLLSSIINRSELLSRVQLLPNGKYVPRGDTPRIRTALTPVNGTHYSRRVGVWIHSDPTLYIMATAGHASITHKHVDETAIYLTYQGIDLFLDGGFHSYGSGDERVKLLRCAAGHSAMGIDGFDSLLPSMVYKRGSEIVEGRLLDPTPDSVTLEKQIKQAGVLTRELAVHKSSLLKLRDSWSLEKAGTPVSRFLLANNATVDGDSDGTVHISRLGVRATLSFGHDVSCTHIPAERTAPYRGWYSTVSGSLIAGSVLEVRPRTDSMTGSFSYTITLAKEPT